MKKLLIATVVTFLASQTPAFAVWLGHCDFESEEDDGKRIRYISVDFGKKKPEEYKSKFGTSKPVFSRTNQEDVETKISDLLPPLFDSKINDFELVFNNVKTLNHFKLMESILDNRICSLGISILEIENIAVNFHDQASQNIKTKCEELYDKEKRRRERMEEDEENERRMEEEEEEDLFESQGAYCGDEDYFSGSDSD